MITSDALANQLENVVANDKDLSLSPDLRNVILSILPVPFASLIVLLGRT